MKILITTDISTPLYKESLKIRKKVFVEEQNVPLELEIEYEDECVHFVAFNKEEIPCGTARLHLIDDSMVKVERMAVLPEFREFGIGSEIMQAMEEYAKENNFQKVIMHAQLTARGFYEKLGYSAYGDYFWDAGIEHVSMKKIV